MRRIPQTRHRLRPDQPQLEVSDVESYCMFLVCTKFTVVLGGTVVVLVVTVEVLPLWDVEHVLWFWTVQHSSINRPKSTEDPEQRTLPAAVWTRDQHIHPLIHLRHADKKSRFLKLNACFSLVLWISAVLRPEEVTEKCISYTKIKLNVIVFQVKKERFKVSAQLQSVTLKKHKPGQKSDVTLDSDLTVTESANCHLKNVSHIKGLMSLQDEEKLVHAFIFSGLNDCNGFP